VAQRDSSGGTSMGCFLLSGSEALLSRTGTAGAVPATFRRVESTAGTGTSDSRAGRAARKGNSSSNPAATKRVAGVEVEETLSRATPTNREWSWVRWGRTPPSGVSWVKTTVVGRCTWSAGRGVDS